MMPFGLVLPRDDDFVSIFTSSVEKSQSAPGPSHSAFLMPRLGPIVTESTTCGRHQYGAALRPRRYEHAARQRGACFEA
eukprot:3698721-Pleurochrysis_carterae.AAC.1